MDGADGIKSDALQAGGRRFDPGHVHQLAPLFLQLMLLFVPFLRFVFQEQ